MYFSINIFEQLPTPLNCGYHVDCSPDIHGLKTKYSAYFIPHSYSTDAFALTQNTFIHLSELILSVFWIIHYMTVC